MFKKLLPGLILIFACAPIHAQEASDEDKDRQYVTDQLRLSLYSHANSSSQVVKLLQSGDLLEIEQIQGPYALVTAPGGARGWVKRGFLVAEPTSNLLLLEEQKRSEGLAAEIEKLNNAKVVIDQYEKDMDKHWEVPEKASEKSDIIVTAETAAGAITGSSVSAGFDFILKDN